MCGDFSDRNSTFAEQRADGIGSSRNRSETQYAMDTNRKALLMILDGWGDGDRSAADAISQTPTPHIDALRAQYPHAQLLTSGENVGLPDGQMGNSEVGHLNIGAGRVVYQDLVRINREIDSGAIAGNPAITQAIAYAKQQGRALHLMGLVSDGGVHSLDRHLYALCDLAAQAGLARTYIHAFTDGRDTDPKSGLAFIRALQAHLKGGVARVATVTGRYYAMDRDKRWERVKIAYDAITQGVGERVLSAEEAIQRSYDAGVTDEFIKPIVCVDGQGNPLATIQPGDAVICFNFRTDRLRELTIALTQRDMPELGMGTLPLHYVTLTRYDETFSGVHVAYEKENLTHTLGETLSAYGCSQLRIAETEKYAHVTFFFSGGREEPFPGESRILIPSPKVPTYDMQPEMSAPQLVEAVVQDMRTHAPDFICLNFANGDMVGHTGVYPAIQEAVRTVDTCVQRVVEAARELGYEVLIIADHGNADYALNPDGTPNTAHSLNPVPIIAVTTQFDAIRSGILADVAPTILQLMHLPIPAQMTGQPLCQ